MDNVVGGTSTHDAKPFLKLGIPSDFRMSHLQMHSARIMGRKTNWVFLRRIIYPNSAIPRKRVSFAFHKTAGAHAGLSNRKPIRTARYSISCCRSLTTVTGSWNRTQNGEIALASLRKASSKPESNDRVRESLRRLRRTEMKVTYISARTGKKRVMETHLLEFTDTDGEESKDGTVQFGIPKRLRVVPAQVEPLGTHPVRGRLCDDQQICDRAL